MSGRPHAVIVYCDGGSRGNPGPAAIGAAVYEDRSGERGRLLGEVSEYIGTATNNVAEYRALIAGLELAEKLGAGSVSVKADSQLVVRQLNGEYRVRHPNVKPLFDRATTLLRGFERWAAVHIPRDENEVADALVNLALDSPPGARRPGGDGAKPG